MTSASKQADGDTALLIMHEIWGVNSHMHSVKSWFQERTDWDVFTPSYLTQPLSPNASESEAYASFMEHTGVEPMARRVAHDLKELNNSFKHVFALGFSVGATATWLAASDIPIEASACIYGSRIRNHLDRAPKSRSLLVMAEHEVSFTPKDVLRKASIYPQVTPSLVPDTTHGFCNPKSEQYAVNKARSVYQDVLNFFRNPAGARNP